MTQRERKFALIRKEKALKYFNGLKNTEHLIEDKHHLIRGIKELKIGVVSTTSAMVYEFVLRIQKRFSIGFDVPEYLWIAERIERGTK